MNYLDVLQKYQNLYAKKTPSKDAWSAAQAIEHLILSIIVSAVSTRTAVRAPTIPELVPSGSLTLSEMKE